MPRESEPVATTAGEQDHSDPWLYAGEETTPPGDGLEDLPESEPDSGGDVELRVDVLGGWRNCNASNKLVEAVNAINPRRSKASDGTIGDTSHSARPSDHNPNKQRIVRARDITRVGLDLPAIFEQLRRMGQAGDRRLAGGGYLILDRRITAPDFSGWRKYSGSNPHISHGHISFSKNPAGFDSNDPWNLGGAYPVPGPGPGGRSTLRLDSEGSSVRELQGMLDIVVDGYFGRATEEAVKAFQRTCRLGDDGVVGPNTWEALDRRVAEQAAGKSAAASRRRRQQKLLLNA